MQLPGFSPAGLAGISLKVCQLHSSVRQAVNDVSFGAAGSRRPLEAFDLIRECPTANVNGPVPVRIHGGHRIGWL